MKGRQKVTGDQARKVHFKAHTQDPQAQAIYGPWLLDF